MHTCHRCGLCCLDIGRTFWKGGTYNAQPALEIMANDGVYEDGSLPCEMLRFDNGLAVCLIHKLFGYHVKPAACRHYPEHETLCFLEELELKQTVDQSIGPVDSIGEITNDAI